MADKKHVEASKIDALYSWLSYDLQKIKAELLKEMKYSSVQFSSLYQEMKNDKDKSSQAISQEIRYSYKQNQTIYDGLAELLTRNVAERLNSMDEKTSSIEEMQGAIKESVASIVEKVETLENVDVEALSETIKEKVADSLSEIKYGYLQQQAVYDGLTTLISSEVVSRLESVENKLAMIEQIDDALAQIQEKLAVLEDADYNSLVESVAEKTEECVAEHSRQVLDAVAAISVAENVDYNRIADEVGDKVLEILGEIGLNEPAPAPAPVPVDAKIDYDRIIYGAAEKVVESLPYPEKVDYRRINDSFVKAVENVQTNVNEEMLEKIVGAAVEKAIAAIDMEALANAVASKIVVPTVAAPEIDYERLSDMVAAKLAATTDQVYDVVLDEAGITQIAEKVSEKLDQVEVNYDRVGEIVEEKLASACLEPTYDLVIDEDGVSSIAKEVSEEICKMCNACEAQQDEIVEETVEEVVEETVEEVAEEVVEEPVVEESVVEEEPVVEEVAEEVVPEEVVEEPVVEEPVAEEPQQEETANEELAVSSALAFDEIDNQLVDAETGLVIRLKKSFTAKMRQSDEKVKEYYSSIKNELTSYKKINSNVSWHGDRFNFGRDTIAKVNICGKTLCFYLALDPENPEFKTSVYHQKNVGAQKAYENTPFMVKIKSDAAVKKALRLVGFLAEKVGTVKKENFEEVNYVEEYAYETTKQLFDEGFIKATKEKKVDLDF